MNKNIINIVGVKVPMSIGLCTQTLIALKAFYELQQSGHFNIRVFVMNGTVFAVGDKTMKGSALNENFKIKN